MAKYIFLITSVHVGAQSFSVNIKAHPSAVHSQVCFLSYEVLCEVCYAIFMPKSCWVNKQIGEPVIVESVQLFGVFMTVAHIYAFELRKMGNYNKLTFIINIWFRLCAYIIQYHAVVLVG